MKVYPKDKVVINIRHKAKGTPGFNQLIPIESREYSPKTDKFPEYQFYLHKCHAVKGWAITELKSGFAVVQSGSYLPFGNGEKVSHLQDDVIRDFDWLLDSIKPEVMHKAVENTIKQYGEAN